MVAKPTEKCTVQIVDLSGTKPRHYARLTLAVDPSQVFQALYNAFARHLVSRKPANAKPAIAGARERSRRVKGQVQNRGSESEARPPQRSTADHA